MHGQFVNNSCNIPSKYKKKKNEEVSNTNLFKKIRKNWNGVNPVSRIVESKKHKKPKYPQKIDEE